MSVIIKKVKKTTTPKGLTSQEKLAELIKACILCGSDSKDKKITKTKLAKLVYLADFTYYYHNLKPISGVTYRKLERGPVSTDYFDQLERLENSSSIIIENKGDAILISLSSNKKPKLAKKELDIVQKVCTKWKGKSSTQIVQFTHGQLPWKISFDKDEIPYSLVIQQDEATLY